MLGDSSSTQSRRVKIAGAVVAAVALAIVGVVALSGVKGDAAAMTPLEKVQALVHAEGANAPLSSLPDESSMETPAGWVIESDEPVDGPGSEEHIEEGSDDVTEESPEVDEDIDSRMEFEEGQDGQKYVAELEPDVIVTGADAATGETAEDLSVESDYKGKTKGCYRKLKACGAKKACIKKCQKKCKPYAIRKCMNKKFCRCYCKYYGKIQKAKKCVYYKRRQCKTSTIYRCRRACKKTCKKVLRCYCCPRSKVLKKCYNLCKKYMYRSKCKKCRCQLTKCVRRCKFLCTHKY